ncbi:hypothetical protein CCACVL1_01575 [Corchorus capsularis]|uniref:Uncharacterized protein n=1 Tax=Corchorus capsularis TaxID=210143 RepID=A0A1R3KH87_COCAP|nr:hypothetical protein CCACVL1_01575 [Corchorus capsularis]
MALVEAWRFWNAIFNAPKCVPMVPGSKMIRDLIRSNQIADRGYIYDPGNSG